MKFALVIICPPDSTDELTVAGRLAPFEEHSNPTDPKWDYFVLDDEFGQKFFADLCPASGVRRTPANRLPGRMLTVSGWLDRLTFGSAVPSAVLTADDEWVDQDSWPADEQERQDGELQWHGELIRIAQTAPAGSRAVVAVCHI
jgi:hypothetical protein